ncbi:MAG TPA: hypothetical protein VJB57_19590 [Dehalococcoidia bacterium]|nr:hypothetical protein [Dehalococcoidia bacterium]
MQFSKYFFDNMVAPNLSELKNPVLPDLGDYRKHRWLNALILRLTIFPSLTDPLRSHLKGFFRRTEAAIEEYEAARAALADYVGGAPEVLTRYWNALNHFEYCISQAHQSLFILRRMTKTDYFSKGDGSVPQKLNAVYNLSHHLEKLVEQGKSDQETGIAIWLTNDGITTTTDSLTYAEIAEVVEGLTDAAILLHDKMEQMTSSVFNFPSYKEEGQPDTKIVAEVTPPSKEPDV